MGGGVSGVNNYSLYEFMSVQGSQIFKQNQIISISLKIYDL